jgi:hypothetical protein
MAISQAIFANCNINKSGELFVRTKSAAEELVRPKSQLSGYAF